MLIYIHEAWKMEESMKTILLVEDDIALSKSLTIALQMKEYNVIAVHCYRDAYIKFKENKVQAVILDIQLPDGNGIQLCKDIRKDSQVPILFLTASDSEDKIVEGLNSGGDDYMTKPFRIQELYARLNAIMRRSGFHSHIIKFGNCEIDLKRREVFKKGESIVLSPIDFEILKQLLLSKDRVLTRQQLLDIIEKDGQYNVENNTLSVHIKRLRHKLGIFQNLPYIETVRGIGYRMNKEVFYGNE